MRIRFDFSTNGVWLEAEPRTSTNELIPEDLWNELIVTKGLNWADGNCAKFEVFRKTDHSEFAIGHFFLSAMPGCCGVCVSHAAYLSPDNRHSGLRHPFRDIKPFIAKRLGYSMMIATTIMTNIPALKSFLDSSYRVSDTFTNPRTGNVIAFGTKKI